MTADIYEVAVSVCFHTEDLCGPASRARCSTSHLALPSVEGRGALAPHRPLDSKVSCLI